MLVEVVRRLSRSAFSAYCRFRSRSSAVNVTASAILAGFGTAVDGEAITIVAGGETISVFDVSADGANVSPPL